MGLFRSPAEKLFLSMAGDFETIVGRIARSSRQDLEPFEGLHRSWNEYMREHGRIGLTMGSIGADSMKYPALIDPRDGVVMAAQFVGLYTIPEFKESKYGRNLERLLEPLAASQITDHGQALNNAFKESNPRSFDFFLSEYGRVPFATIDMPTAMGVTGNAG
jgi:hypothetical protein